MTAWARRRRARFERVALDRSPDPENEDRAWEARKKMRVYDQLGPSARRVARESRFDALDPDSIRRKYGRATEFEDPRVDQLLAADIQREDNYYSGRFGPAAPSGI